MAEYKKQTPKQAVQKPPAQNAPKQNTPSIRARIDRLVDNEETSVKAHASVTIGGIFAIHDVRVYESETKGTFVSMPFNQYKDSEGKTQYSQICHPITAEARHQVTQAVMKAYQQALEQAQQQGESETHAENPSAEVKLKPNM